MSLDNYQDVIDSRDVIARIEELESLQSNLGDAVDAYRTAYEKWLSSEEEYGPSADELLDAETLKSNAEDSFGEDEEKELEDLQSLAEDASGSPDWVYGETLIRDSYSEEYAQQLAEDCGYLDQKGTNRWPFTCIDWEKAARELQYDYFSCEFSGITYWIRS